MNKNILARLAAKKATPESTPQGIEKVAAWRRLCAAAGIELPEKFDPPSSISEVAKRVHEAKPSDEGTILSNARELLRHQLKRLTDSPPMEAPTPRPMPAPPPTPKARVNEPVVRGSCCGMVSEHCCHMITDGSAWERNTKQPHVPNMAWTPRSTKHGPY